VREKYCWLVADKPSEQAVFASINFCSSCKHGESHFCDTLCQCTGLRGSIFDFL
jgi:hypothetical protein